MDLAMVTGRGPDQLTNIDGQRPYFAQPIPSFLVIAGRRQPKTRLRLLQY